jgi:hypothetical protein
MMKALLLLALLTLSCGTPGNEASTGREDQGDLVSVDQLRSTPTRVEIGGVTVQLDASLWVNVGPTMPRRSGPAPINGVVTVAASTGTLAGNVVRIDHVWLLSGDQMWETADPEEQDEQDPGYVDTHGVPRNRPGSPTFRIALRSGPSWDRPSLVDVIVRIVDPAGRAYLLRAPDQAVGSVQ